MITIEFNEKDYQIRNSVEEITIEEFEAINFILNGDDTLFSKWMDILRTINVDEDVIENIDLNAFLKLVLTFDFNRDDFEVIKTIQIDGADYSLFQGEEFKLRMKELAALEKVVSKNEFYFATLLATLYKADKPSLIPVDPTQHFKYKETFFKTQPCSIILPILKIINDSLIKKMTLLFNETNGN